MSDKKDGNRQLLIALLIPMTLFFLFMSYRFYNIITTPTVEETRGTFVMLNDTELEQIIGQAGIFNIGSILGLNDVFGTEFDLANNDITVGDLETFMYQYLAKLQTEDPAEMVRIYTTMVHTLNTEGHFEITMSTQHLFEQIVMDGIDVIQNTVSNLNLGTFGVTGLKIEATGTVIIRVNR